MGCWEAHWGMRGVLRRMPKGYKERC